MTEGSSTSDNQGFRNDEAEPFRNSPVPFDYLGDVPDCPPAGAVETNSVFYCCHEYNPAGPSDFRTAAQRNHFLGLDECRRRSYSIMRELRDAKSLKKLYPMVRRFISAGDIVPHHGFVLHTGGRYQSHHSLWLRGGVSMHAIFN